MEPEFWRRHALWPLLAFIVVFATWEILALDRPMAEALFFDTDTRHWLGSGSGDWWARALIHDTGRWIIRVLIVSALVVWALSFRIERLRTWRRSAGFVFLATALATLIVGGLKSVTNVDCPWDLAGYGGDNPYVPLFADRPDGLPHAKCFPGAHSSSGFALMCFYFAWRDRSRRLARWALAGGIAVGLIFSIGQEARGAHFISHDFASAAIVWFVQLGLYAWMLKPREPATVPAAAQRT